MVQLHRLGARVLGEDQAVGHAVRFGEGDADEIGMDVLPYLERDDRALVELAVREQLHRVERDLGDAVGPQRGEVLMGRVVILRHPRLHHDQVEVVEHPGVDHFGAGGAHRARHREAQRRAQKLQEQAAVPIELRHEEPLHDVVGHAQPAQVVPRFDAGALQRGDVDAGARRVLDHARPYAGKHAALHEERRRHADGALAALDAARAGHRLVGAAHDLEGVPVERLARRGELDAAVPAVEPHDAQPLLEEVDLLDEGGRRDVERARRLGEASGVRGLDERLDMARVHGCPFA